MRNTHLCHSREGGNPWPDLSKKRVVHAEAQRTQSSLSAPLRLCVNKKWLKLRLQAMDSRVRGNDKMGRGGVH